MAIWGIRYTKNIQKRYTPFSNTSIYHPYNSATNGPATSANCRAFSGNSGKVKSTRVNTLNSGQHPLPQLYRRPFNGTWTSSGWHCRLREPCYHRGRYPQTTAINFDAMDSYLDHPTNRNWLVTLVIVSPCKSPKFVASPIYKWLITSYNYYLSCVTPNHSGMKHSPSSSEWTRITGMKHATLRWLEDKPTWKLKPIKVSIPKTMETQIIP